jgi:hypothetical protein
LQKATASSPTAGEQQKAEVKSETQRKVAQTESGSSGNTDDKRVRAVDAPSKAQGKEVGDGTVWRIIFFTVVLTVLISAIEVPVRSKTRLVSSFTAAFWLYAAILNVGNIASALLATMVVGVPWPQFALPFFYAFFGVFAFQGVMSNTNLTFFDKGVLTIQDWIGKARDYAVETAVVNQVKKDDRRTQALAGRLSADITEAQLNTNIIKSLGKDILKQMDTDAAASSADGRFYKALVFASQKPSEAEAIVRQLPRKT